MSIDISQVLTNKLSALAASGVVDESGAAYTTESTTAAMVAAYGSVDAWYDNCAASEGITDTAPTQSASTSSSFNESQVATNKAEEVTNLEPEELNTYNVYYGPGVTNNMSNPSIDYNFYNNSYTPELQTAMNKMGINQMTFQSSKPLSQEVIDSFANTIALKGYTGGIVAEGFNSKSDTENAKQEINLGFNNWSESLGLPDMIDSIGTPDNLNWNNVDPELVPVIEDFFSNPNLSPEGRGFFANAINNTSGGIHYDASLGEDMAGYYNLNNNSIVLGPEGLNGFSIESTSNIASTDINGAFGLTTVAAAETSQPTEVVNDRPLSDAMFSNPHWTLGEELSHSTLHNNNQIPVSIQEEAYVKSLVNDYLGKPLGEVSSFDIYDEIESIYESYFPGITNDPNISFDVTNMGGLNFDFGGGSTLSVDPGVFSFLNGTNPF